MSEREKQPWKDKSDKLKNGGGAEAADGGEAEEEEEDTE